MNRRSLTIVGTGLRAGIDTTPEARAYIQRADKVLYLVADMPAAAWIEEINPNAESLAEIYASHTLREDIYAEIVERIIAWLRRSNRLCVAFYGHPGVFSYVGHESMRRARLEQADALMLPAISAADCLFADLGVDPGALGCQSYEATSFLIYGYRFDPHAALLLWQIGALGDSTWPPAAQPECLSLLVERLEPHYGLDHEMVIYEAACDAVSGPSIVRVTLAQLVRAPTSTGSTLYVPPKGSPQADPQVLARLRPTTRAALQTSSSTASWSRT